MSIKTLSLLNYRNFTSLDMEPSGCDMLIVGPNGAGKTNILEAISILSPGLGLRNASYLEMTNVVKDFWQIDAVVNSYAPFQISLSCNKSSSLRKQLLINDQKSQISELLKILYVIWLTPQMLNLLIGPSLNRRKFLDRIAYAYDSNHATNCTKYAYYLTERLKLLQSYGGNEQWLSIVEQNLAELAAQIAILRQQSVQKLQNTLNKIKNIGFAEVSIEIIGAVEQLSSNHTESELIEHNLKKFYDNRHIDSQKKQTTFGPHKSDLKTTYIKKNIDGGLCSTGEQKIILITLTLAQALELDEKRSSILLLDEIFTHLDDTFRSSVSSLLLNLKAHKWITTTEMRHIDLLNNNYQIITLS